MLPLESQTTGPQTITVAEMFSFREVFFWSVFLTVLMETNFLEALRWIVVVRFSPGIPMQFLPLNAQWNLQVF